MKLVIFDAKDRPKLDAKVVKPLDEETKIYRSETSWSWGKNNHQEDYEIQENSIINRFF